MRIVTLSDIHIKELNDEGHLCLKSFFSHPLTQSATHIALLGDIFDLMAGNHEAYIQRWQEIFDEIRNFCEKGVVVYFAEGNHDMHLKRLVRRISAGWGEEAGHRFQVIEDYKIIELIEKKVLIGHGDEYNRNDLTYLKYKKFIKAPALNFLADYLMPLSALDYLGKKASKKSRAYGERTYNEIEVREKFRNGILEIVPTDVDLVIGGHSHVIDNWVTGKMQYLNNGYPPKSKKFVVFDLDGARLENL